MYHYAGNNPVKDTAPDGNAVHVVIGAGIGAVGGLAQNVANTGTELITKSFNGEKIDLKQTTIEFAVNTTKDVTIGTVVGAMCAIKGGIHGINSGKGSMSSVAKATMTKLDKGIISNVSVKTSAKIATSHCVEGALVSGTILGNMINSPVSEYTNSILDNQTKNNKAETDFSQNIIHAYEP